MKLLFDFFPILLFFLAYMFGADFLPADDPAFQEYREHPIYLATMVAMAAAVVQVSYAWIRHRKVDNMLLVSFVLIMILGAATLYLKNPLFIKWKGTAVNWLFGLVFGASQIFGERTVIQRTLGEQLELPVPVLRRLNLIWTLFFFVMGGVNLFVAYNFDEKTWVQFKMFGMLGMTFLFVILQTAYLYRYLPEEAKSKE